MVDGYCTIKIGAELPRAIDEVIESETMTGPLIGISNDITQQFITCSDTGKVPFISTFTDDISLVLNPVGIAQNTLNIIQFLYFYPLNGAYLLVIEYWRNTNEFFIKLIRLISGL